MRKNDIVTMVMEVSNYLSLRYNVEQEQESCSNNDNQNRHEKNNGSNSNSGEQPCHKHDGAHKCKDCSQKKYGNNYKLGGEMNSMEE